MLDTELPLSEVAWARESRGLFLGSPSIVSLPNSTYLVSHDEFGPGAVRHPTPTTVVLLQLAWQMHAWHTQRSN